MFFSTSKASSKFKKFFNCPFVIYGLDQSSLKDFLCVFWFWIHCVYLEICRQFVSVYFISCLMRYHWRFWIGSFYGICSIRKHLSLYNQYGIEWTCSYGCIGCLGSLMLSTYANLSTHSFPSTLACTLTLYVVIGSVCFVEYNV